MEVSKSDWKLFQSKLPGWQEAYMDKLNREYINILSSDDIASMKFWTLEKRIKEDRKRAGVRCEISRSSLIYRLLSLLHDGAITMDDLEEFSDELKEVLQAHLSFAEDDINGERRKTSSVLS